MPENNHSLQALQTWRRRLDHFLAEEAIAVDAAQKFAISEEITICKDKIKELEQKRNIYQNLPCRHYETFFGRSQEIKHILSFLSYEHAAHIISINGIGGVGKTALATEVAYKCLYATQQSLENVPHYDAIIFTSAKENYLVDQGILPRRTIHRTLIEIIGEIAEVLEEPNLIVGLSRGEQSRKISSIFRKMRVLLIVDNMETIDTNEAIEIKGFLYNLPPTVKIIVTSREELGFSPISLTCLKEIDSIRLIEQQVKEKNDLLAVSNERLDLTAEQIREIYTHTGGIPLAIIYVVGLLSIGYNLSRILTELIAINDAQLAKFCFDTSIDRIRDNSAYELLFALAIFDESCTLNSLAYIADVSIEGISLEEGLILLKQLSFINSIKQSSMYDMDRYEMLPLTRYYVKFELNKNPDIEKSMRQRWIDYYLAVVKEYGGEDWGDKFQYNELKKENNNIRQLLEWCKINYRYDDIKNFWIYLFHYASLDGNWQDTRNWLKWLIKESTRRGEWADYVEFTNRISWLLIREGSDQSLKRAKKMLSNAWNFRSEARGNIKADLAENLARLNIKYQNYEQAYFYLEQEKEYVLEFSKQFEIDKYHQIRLYLPTQYHDAVIKYKQKNYFDAKNIFKNIMISAQQIKWSRVVNSAQSWLADIALIDNDRDESRKHISQGRITAESNRNYRRLARYLRSSAIWEKKWGNIEQARSDAQEALRYFNQYKMYSEAENMKMWIQSELSYYLQLE
jgi:LuxR family glucitol operon transcriptional activator